MKKIVLSTLAALFVAMVAVPVAVMTASEANAYAHRARNSWSHGRFHHHAYQHHAYQHRRYVHRPYTHHHRQHHYGQRMRAMH